MSQQLVRKHSFRKNGDNSHTLRVAYCDADGNEKQVVAHTNKNLSVLTKLLADRYPETATFAL